MALGYEGYVQIGLTVALGTGTSVPRARARIESSAGYGGKIVGSPAGFRMGVGFPRAYDWTTYDGSVDMELNRLIWKEELNPWIFDRQSARDIIIVTRKDGEQNFNQTAFWSSISISASEGSAVTSSVSFVALNMTTYTFGATGLEGYIDNKKGFGMFCPPWSNVPLPLNKADSGRRNINPIPFWNTKIQLPAGPTVIDFTSWTLDFSQDVVKFFTCQDEGSTTDPGALEPAYLAVGPMTVTLSGSYMLRDRLGDNIDELDVILDDQTLKLKMLENTTVSDDLQNSDALVPLTVEYAVYNLDQS